MPEQVITQEELFLPLLQFIADHGGQIDREADELLERLADRLGLTGEERNRTTDEGRDQWRSTVEWSREKLIENHEAILRGTRGIWRLSEEGWRIVTDPPSQMVESFEAWRQHRMRVLPGNAPLPPARPGGEFGDRLEQIQESLKRTIRERLQVARNRALARVLKEEYEFRCQLCDPNDPDCPEIQMDGNRRYVEVHHIEGLAEVAAMAEHGEVDETVYSSLTSYHNVIVVCVYHHRLLHHYHRPFTFQKSDMRFVADDGSFELPIRVRHRPHLEGDET